MSPKANSGAICVLPILGGEIFCTVLFAARRGVVVIYLRRHHVDNTIIYICLMGGSYESDHILVLVGVSPTLKMFALIQVFYCLVMF